jgi:hypothetical protein
MQKSISVCAHISTGAWQSFCDAINDVGRENARLSGENQTSGRHKALPRGDRNDPIRAYCLPVSLSSSGFWHETGKAHNLGIAGSPRGYFVIQITFLSGHMGNLRVKTQARRPEGGQYENRNDQ